jgi:hypothetical protein
LAGRRSGCGRVGWRRHRGGRCLPSTAFPASDGSNDGESSATELDLEQIEPAAGENDLAPSIPATARGGERGKRWAGERRRDRDVGGGGWGSPMATPEGKVAAGQAASGFLGFGFGGVYLGVGGQVYSSNE